MLERAENSKYSSRANYLGKLNHSTLQCYLFLIVRHGLLLFLTCSTLGPKVTVTSVACG